MRYLYMQNPGKCRFKWQFPSKVCNYLGLFVFSNRQFIRAIKIIQLCNLLELKPLLKG